MAKNNFIPDGMGLSEPLKGQINAAASALASPMIHYLAAT